jgi:hypothetical protein
MSGFSFGMPRSKAGALQYQKDLKAELMAIRVKEMTDSATPADLERAKKIVRYFTEIGKPIMKATDLEPIPVEDASSECARCKGSGRNGANPCEKCNGSGWADPKKQGKPFTDAKDSARKARLHRALDAVMDRRAAKDSAKGMTSTELRDEIRAVKAQISGGAGIMLKREKPERYEQLEKRLTELLDAASYR